MKKLYIIILFLLTFSNSIFSQVDNEFWFVVPEVSWRHASNRGEPTFFRISSLSDTTVIVKIEMPALNIVLGTITILKGESRNFDLTGWIRNNYNPANPATGVPNDPNRGTPNDNNIIESGLPGMEGVYRLTPSRDVEKRGILITSSLVENVNHRINKITVYLDRFNTNNKDLFALKGKNALGKNFTMPGQNFEPDVSITTNPATLSGFDIVATQDATSITIIPTKAIKREGNTGTWPAGVPINIILNKGETFSCIARNYTSGAHLGGSTIESDKPIAVTWKDDSLRPDNNGGYDLAGDQLIPDKLAGYEYIVMRGQLTDPEYAYVTAVKSGTTVVNWDGMDTGGTMRSGSITLTGRGNQKRIGMNSGVPGISYNINALHIEADQDVLVSHITGYGSEVGGAIVPTIDICTGSKDVSIIRSLTTSSDRFFINIMTDSANIGDFKLYINGSSSPDSLNPAWFSRVASTDWYYLEKPHNNFTNAVGTPGSPYYIHDIGKDQVVRITNPGRFHLSIIEGSSSVGCKYGYFSSFSVDTVQSSIGADQGTGTTLCYGDTVILNASGGKDANSYLWWFEGPPSAHKFITDSTIANPLAIVTPSSNMRADYKVKINLECPVIPTSSTDTVIPTQVKVYEKINVDFDTVLVSPSCCSPAIYKLNNHLQAWCNYRWTIENEHHTTVDSVIPVISDPIEFTNRGAVPVNYRILLKSDQNYACQDSIEKVIRVKPEIVAKAVKGAKSGCQQDVTQGFKITNSSGPFTDVLWDWGDGTGQENYPHPNDMDTVYTHTFVNLTNYDTTYYITLVLIDSVNDCRDTANIDSVFVPGVARARYSILNKKGCSPLYVDIQNNSNGIVDYEWSFHDGNLATPTVDATTNFIDTTIVYTNNNTTPQYYYVYLKIIKHNDDGTDCEDFMGPDTITVYPEFNTTITTTDPLQGCDPLTIDFNQTTNPNVTNLQYEWTFGDGTSSGVANPPAKTYSHIIPSDQNYQVNLITTSKYNCKDTAPPVDVTVYAYVDSKFTVSPDTVGCSPLTLRIANNSSANSVKNFVWDIGGGAGTTSDTQPFDIIYTNTTGATVVDYVSLTNSNAHGCDVVYKKDITVFPEITALFTKSNGTDTVCNNVNITFSNTSIFTGAAHITSATPTAEFLWDFGDGTTSALESPAKSYNNSTSSLKKYYVKLTLSVNGCTDIYIDSVFVYPQIKAQMNTDKTIICAPTTIQINNTSIGASNYLWTFSDGSPARTTTDLSSINFTVNNPKPNDTIHIHIYLTASNSTCTDYDTITLQVYPEINPHIQPDVTEGCGPLEVNLTNQTTGGGTPTNPLTFLWDFDDGETSNLTDHVVTHTFGNRTTSDKIYSVSLKATNLAGCSATYNTSITVYPEIEARFTFKKNTECSPMPVFIDNASFNGSVFQYRFNNHDTTAYNSNDFYYTFYHTGADPNAVDNYDIRLIVLDPAHPQCADTAIHTIKIYPPVVSNFIVSDNDIGCSPLNTEFTNNSTGYGLTYIWDYRDGNSSANSNNVHSHIFDNIAATNAVYDVKLTASDTNGCTDVSYQQVTAYPKVTADFTFIKDVNDKCTPYPVDFSYSESALNGNKFSWDFGDFNDTVDLDKNAFTHIYDNTTLNSINIYTIRLIAADTITGCADTASKKIKVYPRLRPAFVVDTFQGCNPLTVNFDNRTTGLAVYLWDFDDEQSSTEENPQHIFSHYENNDKQFDVVLTATQSATGCVNTASQQITVYSYLNPKFALIQASGSKAGQLLGGCTPFDVKLTDSSTCNYRWYWDFGDGTTQIDNSQPSARMLTYTNDMHIEPLLNKKYTIGLVVENNHGCTKATSQTLEVYPRSTPDFETIYQGCHPLTVNFTNRTVDDGNSQYYWYLGDGATAVEEELTHTYFNNSYYDNKIFDVKLICTTSNLCSDSITKQITVYPKPLAAINPIKDRGCSPLTAQLENVSKGTELIFYWDFDNGETKTTVDVTTEYPEYINNTDVVDERHVELIIETGLHCKDTITQLINVYPETNASFTYYDPADTAGCSPHQVSFLNTSNAAATVFKWDFGTGATSQLKNPTYRYVNETDNDQRYPVTLRVESPYGCSSVFRDTITVYLSPNAEFFVQEPVITYPDTIMTFENKVKPGPWTFLWDYGNGETSTNENKIHSYSYYGWGPKENDFSYKVWLKAYSAHCTDSIWQIVTIMPPNPLINIVERNPMGCVPLNVEFKSSYEYGYTNSIRWTFGDGGISSEVNPIYTYNTSGIFIATVSIKGDGGNYIDTTKVSVFALPEPNFEFSPDFVMLPDQPVQFFNTTYLAEQQTYMWHFGDGRTSNEINPWHQYTWEGVFDVKLVATTKHGCVDSVTVANAVTVSGEGYIMFPNAFLPSAESPEDGSYSIPDADNNVFHPVWEGVRDYELWVFNRWGEQVFYSDDVKIGWNGRYGNTGDKLGQDVYFWKTKGRFENDVPFKKAGDVTLIRK